MTSGRTSAVMLLFFSIRYFLDFPAYQPNLVLCVVILAWAAYIWV